MAYKCPRCGGPASRGSNSGVAIAAGLIGALIFAAFGSFQCKACGKLKKSEFSAEDQSKMRKGSIALVVGGVLILVAVVVLVVAINA